MGFSIKFRELENKRTLFDFDSSLCQCYAQLNLHVKTVN